MNNNEEPGIVGDVTNQNRWLAKKHRENSGNPSFASSKGTYRQAIDVSVLVCGVGFVVGKRSGKSSGK